MTGSEFLDNIGDIDDDLVSEADSWVRPKPRRSKLLVAAAAAAACLCLTVGLSFGLSAKKQPTENEGVDIGCGLMLDGADEIYPTVMVDGRLYEWKFGKAIVDSLPVGSVYYGKLNHMIGLKAPEFDRDFVSVFSASGRIFVDPDNDLVYLELTTDWLENAIVTFVPPSPDNRVQ